MSAMDDSLWTFRVGKLETDMEKKADVDDLVRIEKKVDGVQKTLTKLMFTIATTAIVFAFGILAYFAEHPHG